MSEARVEPGAADDRARPDTPAVLDAVGHAVVTTDPEGRITSWNRRAEELFDWDRNYGDLGYSLYLRFGVGACYFLNPVNEELRKRRHY